MEATPSPPREEIERLDVAVYAAIAATPTPKLDVAMARLSKAADYSALSIASAAALAIAGGANGRRAAVSGLGSVAVTAAVVNLALKQIWRRPRPDRVAHEVPALRHVPMPRSRSFPSGHSAAAFAFAAGAGRELPVASLPLHAQAAAIAYSRVHTGVHYPLDALAGSLLGTVFGQISSHGLDRLRHRRAGSSPR